MLVFPHNLKYNKWCHGGVMMWRIFIIYYLNVTACLGVAELMIKSLYSYRLQSPTSLRCGGTRDSKPTNLH